MSQGDRDEGRGESECRTLSELEKEQVRVIKQIGEHFVELCTQSGMPGDRRCMDLAKTNAEQAVLWAV